MPKIMMTSPGLARREAYPETAPGGATKVWKSGNSAPNIAIPEIQISRSQHPRRGRIHDDGIGSAGSGRRGHRNLLHAGCTFDGTSAFTWPGLMKLMKADWPPMITLVPLSEVGAFTPLKAPPQSIGPAAKFDP